MKSGSVYYSVHAWLDKTIWFAVPTRKREEKLEEAIGEVIAGVGLKKLPLLPSQQTMHLMAKATVTVYQSAVENQDRDN